MPALSVSIDGNTIATVCTDGYDTLSIHAGGTRIDDDLANLDIAGGSYPKDGESTYLTWVNALPLQSGQVVIISFIESATSSHAGKTIEELFPDEEPIEMPDFKPTTEMFNELRAKPKLRDQFYFRLESSLGTSFVGETTPDEHGFGFTILWHSSHPERARVSLHSYTLESMEARGPTNYHVEERIHVGDSVRLEIADLPFHQVTR
jgi:hypothetical protein